MVKRILLFLFAVSILIPCVYADQAPAPEKVEVAFIVMADCINASLASEYSPVNISLPSITMSVDGVTRLPLRLSFFLADPVDIRQAIAVSVSSRQRFLSNLFSVEVTVSQDGYLFDIGEIMSTREYRFSDYLLTGSVDFYFPQDMDVESFVRILRTRSHTDDFMKVELNLGIYEAKDQLSIFVEGAFLVSVDTEGTLVVACEDGYKVNGFAYAPQTFFY